jgi:hypothetical protein
MSRNTKTKGIIYNPNDDQEVIDYMNQQLPNCSKYVLNLVKKDMKEQNKVTNIEDTIMHCIEKFFKNKSIPVSDNSSDVEIDKDEIKNILDL